MNQVDDLKLIKKHYGEKFSHLCRELFPTILERPGLLYKLIDSCFAPNRSLYDDIVKEHMEEEFKDLIFSRINVEKNYEVIVDKTPAELLKEAGYTLYECKTEEDIQSFRKYYAPKESLCSFRGGRLDRCHVFFAVKDNVDEIKREDFSNPKRQDEYGTSVISIQFTKDKFNTLSIKNRYNHTVQNPDATFSNNLDNIIPGLTKAFNQEYNLNARHDNIEFEMENYTVGPDGKIYKYNYEINYTYYCPDNIIIRDGKINKYDKARYIIADCFIFDLKKDRESDIKNNKIELFDKGIKDSFLKTFENVYCLDSEYDIETGNRKIMFADTVIEVNKLNQIIGYSNSKITDIDTNFFHFNKTIENINIENVINIGDNFLQSNERIKSLNLPNLKEVGINFLYRNECLNSINAPKLEKIDDFFLCENKKLKSICLDNAISVGKCFLATNKDLYNISLINAELIDDDFLACNESLLKLYLPNVTDIKMGFMRCNNSLEVLSLPMVENIGALFLPRNNTLEYLNAPELKKINYLNFLDSNTTLSTININDLGICNKVLYIIEWNGVRNAKSKSR